jgi:hypothetical protein
MSGCIRSVNYVINKNVCVVHVRNTSEQPRSRRLVKLQEALMIRKKVEEHLEEWETSTNSSMTQKSWPLSR